MRSALRGSVRGVRDLTALRVLPLRVARFQWRARRRAARRGDWFSLASATRPRDLAVLLELARGRSRVVELGTATGWTAIALALADSGREVITYDPIDRPDREAYMALAAPAVRGRITYVSDAGSSGPRDDEPVDLLYIDSSHDRQATLEELDAWLPALRAGSLVVFDDFDHPEYPGVREAVAELGLSGRQRGTLFVHPR
jgi:predicted O-methyltransferase YrrM